jgi:hypothetical protein
MVTELAVDIASFPQRMHLVNPHALQLVSVLLQRVDQLDRLTISVGHDDVGARRDVIQHGLKRQQLGRECSARHLFPSCVRSCVLAIDSASSGLAGVLGGIAFDQPVGDPFSDNSLGLAGHKNADMSARETQFGVVVGAHPAIQSP